jgi:glycosyltransferase involved in cell wall biosynthesis
VRDAGQSGRLRILFVTSDKFPPFRPAAKAIFSEGLSGSGHRIDWLLQAAHSGISPGPRRYRGGVAYVAPTHDGHTRLARLGKYWAEIRNDLRIVGLMRRRTYTLIQVKDKYLGALIAIAAGRFYGVPVFYWLAYPHGEASLYAARNGIARYALFYRLRGVAQRWLLYRIVMKACAHVFVQSEQMRSDLVREGVPRDKMTAVPSSVNLADYAAAPSQESGESPAADARSIVYLGTLLRERRLDFLVRVFAKVLARVAGARLVFVGGGENPEDENLLWREARSVGVSNAMTITGWIPMQDAMDHVRRAGVAVSPYFPVPILLSTSPTKLIEYMALGKAVVANHHPEQSLVLQQSGGGLLCAWDESEFADAIVLLLENPHVARSMGQAGRCFVEAHRTHSTMTKLVADRYAGVLRRSSGADQAAHEAGASGTLRNGWMRKLQRRER